MNEERAWIDISVTLKTGMVHWPGDPPFLIEMTLDMERGDKANLSAISMGSHSGTHMDAPLHFIQTGKGLDEMPFDATIGAARVIEIFDHESIKPEELVAHSICSGERILFKTGNSERCWKTDSFIEDFIYISTGAAHFLAEKAVRTVGIDYLSVGGYGKNGKEVHRVLLEAGIWIIEGLDLSEVKGGIYELICLPLKILNSDGAPARAVLGKKREPFYESNL
ncbi:MAG: cyclase family protein [Nitrospirae bacterium]|nr:cyclase family protein [Nitrospirota bacterium]